MPRKTFDKSIYFEIGNRIRIVREVQDITQGQLGLLTNLSRTSVVNIEAGRQGILVHKLIEIAEALKVRPKRLLPFVQKGRPKNAKR